MALAQQKPNPQNAPLLERLAGFNKAAGDALRLQILRLLHRDSYGVLELATIFDIRQSGMSHHLKVLANAGLVSKRREGNSIFYSRSHQAPSGELGGLQQQLLGLADELPLPADIQKRLETVQQQRAEHSRSFFEQHAGRFTQQQEQISEFEVYARPIATLLDQLPDSGRHSVLEIGPGSGLFLGELRQRFDTVFALDNSQEMLETARQHYTDTDLDRLGPVDFVLGDTQVALQQQLEVQNIVMNMVLHHVPSPPDLIRDISALLTSGGQLFIAELCAHDQDWVRKSCGDLWLGIHPDSLSEWAAQHQLTEVGNGQYLSLRNGFQVQIRQFSKTPMTLN